MAQPLNPIEGSPFAASDGTDSLPPTSAESQAAASQAKVDRLIQYVSEQIELLAFEEPDPAVLSQVLDQMIQGLSDSRRAARISLVEAFSEIGEPATPFLLSALINHPEPIVRRACCNALTNIGDETSVAGLINALLEDSDISVKSAAAGALAKIGAPAFDALRGVLASENASESCKGHAAWAIASMSDEVSEQLYQRVDDPSTAVRMAVTGAIAQLAQKQLAQKQLAQKQSGAKVAPTGLPSTNPEPKALTILMQALSDRASDVRIEAAAHLARLNYQPASSPLINCLGDDDWEVRKAATLALGKLGDVEAIAAIAPLQNDPEIAVQQIATLVVGQLNAQHRGETV
ncbi:MAG: HEAT repeat domain-containing protein [Phormidesmis sp.]